MGVKFKQKCIRCRKNYVVVSGRDYPVCYECQKNELNVKISNPKMRKLFDIPEELYEKNYFLRDIKIRYLKFRNLSEKQIDAFKKTVEKLGKD